MVSIVLRSGAEPLIISAGELYNVARTAYERTKGASSDRAQHDRDPLIAVVFSVITLEAFINEVAQLAAREARRKGNPPSVAAFADLTDEIEESRGSLGLKFCVARHLFAGHPYDKGSQPYQDFDLLIDLRHALIHWKPREKFEPDGKGGLAVKPPDIVGRLRAKNILAELEAGQFIAWISTRAVARWACNTAAAMVRSIAEVIPDSPFKEEVRSYGKIISPVK